MIDRLLAIRAVAAMLDVSDNTVRKLVKEGHLPAPVLVCGTMPRWKLSWVQGYLHAASAGLLPNPRQPQK